MKIALNYYKNYFNQDFGELSDSYSYRLCYMDYDNITLLLILSFGLINKFKCFYLYKFAPNSQALNFPFCFVFPVYKCIG